MRSLELVSVVAVSVFAACGVGVEPEEPGWSGQPSPGQAQVEPAPEASAPSAAASNLPRVPTARERTGAEARKLTTITPEPPFAVSISAGGFADEGKDAHVVTAAPSCGWWVTAHGVADITNGGFAMTLSDALMGQSMHGVFVFVDRDGDALCDTAKGDLLLMTEVTGDQPLALTIDPSTMQPGHGWECFLFNGYGF